MITIEDSRSLTHAAQILKDAAILDGEHALRNAQTVVRDALGVIDRRVEEAVRLREDRAMNLNHDRLEIRRAVQAYDEAAGNDEKREACLRVAALFNVSTFLEPRTLVCRELLRLGTVHSLDTTPDAIEQAAMVAKVSHEDAKFLAARESARIFELVQR